MHLKPNFRRLHFSLKDRLVSFISDKLFRDFEYTVRHGLISGMKRKGGLGFLPAALVRPRQSSAEEVFLQSLNLKDKVVYDIGAFQGVMTLFFARQAKAVITYEPHPANYRRAMENVELNRLNNVTLLNRAVGSRESTLKLTWDPRMPGAASGEATIADQISSSVAQVHTVEVPVMRLDDEIERSGLPLPDFIKIDIEGMELDALEGMKTTLARQHPALYIEIHGATERDKEEKVSRVVQFLAANGYVNIEHVESGETITAANASAASEGHLYCRAAAG